MTPRRLLLAAAAVAVVAYCVANVVEVFRTYDPQPDTAKVVAGIRTTGPGWQR